MLYFRRFGSLKKNNKVSFFKVWGLTLSLLRTLILHEQVYKYVLSVKQHVQIIHNTKVKISIVLVQFADIYFCTENISGERGGSKFLKLVFLMPVWIYKCFQQIKSQQFATFFYYTFSYTFKIWIFKYSVFFSYPFVCVCFPLEILKASIFFPFPLDPFILYQRIQILCMLLSFNFMKILKLAITGLLDNSSIFF